MARNWGRGGAKGPAWERRYVLARDPFCYLNWPGCTRISTIDEHVLGRAAGGTDDLANRRGACKHCNDAKRKIEAAAGAPSTRHPPEVHPADR